WEVIEGLPAPLRQRLSQPTNDRSKALFGVVHELAKLGHDHATIVGVLIRFPEGPASKHRTQDDLDRDVGRILSKRATGSQNSAGQEELTMDEQAAANDDETEVNASNPPDPLPGLNIDQANLPAAAERLRDIFAASGRLFDRGGPVKMILGPNTTGVIAKQL